MSYEFTYLDQLFGIPVAVLTLYLFYPYFRWPSTARGYWLLGLGLLYSSGYLGLMAWKTGAVSRIGTDLFWPIFGGFIVGVIILIVLVVTRNQRKSGTKAGAGDSTD